MTRMSRTLLALPATVALMLPAAPALAADTTTGYQQTPPPPSTTTGYQQTPTPPTTAPSSTKPASGTGPSKETATPTTSTSPANTATTPSTSTAAHAGNSTLPFTGLDLRWIIGAGLFLLAAGLSIRLTQRRHGSDLGR